MKRISYAFLPLTILALAGCGNGGDDTSSPTTTNTASGKPVSTFSAATWDDSKLVTQSPNATKPMSSPTDDSVESAPAPTVIITPSTSASTPSSTMPNEPTVDGTPNTPSATSTDATSAPSSSSASSTSTSSSTSAPSSSSASPSTLTGTPAAHDVTIPALGYASPLTTINASAGALSVPKTGLGWYSGSATPGSTGTSVLLTSSLPKSSSLRVGQMISVRGTTYRIATIKHESLSAMQTDQALWAKSTGHNLGLVQVSGTNADVILAQAIS